MLCNTPDSGALDERAAAKSLTELKELMAVAAQQQDSIEVGDEKMLASELICTDSVCYSTWKPKREV